VRALVRELGDEVPPPQLERVHAELLGQRVHRQLDEVGGLGPPGTANRVGRELVGEHADDVGLDRREVVAPADHARAERGDHRALDQVVRAAVLDDLGVDPGQLAVTGGADLHVVDLVTPVVGDQHLL
jgi:hypothetical protein